MRNTPKRRKEIGNPSTDTNIGTETRRVKRVNMQGVLMRRKSPENLWTVQRVKTRRIILKRKVTKVMKFLENLRRNLK